MTEDRSASFVELFFDLVFVFGITQVVASIHGHLDWPTLGKAAIVLQLLWWAWTQFTWTAGNADFDELRPRLVLLVATAATFVLATAVQGAYADDGVTFALAYFGVMSLVAVFYMFLAMGTDQMAGFLAYAPRVMVGSVLVLIGGFVSEDFRVWVWLAAVVVQPCQRTGRREQRVQHRGQPFCRAARAVRHHRLGRGSHRHRYRYRRSTWIDPVLCCWHVHVAHHPGDVVVVLRLAVSDR